MPLHVNLYHEVQRQALARKRDPLRLAMLGMLVIAAGFVINYFVVLGSAHVVGERYASLQADFSRLDPKAKAAKARQAELNDEISASDTLMGNVNGRFFWAPVLDKILQVVPENVQLTHVGADASTDSKTPVSVVSISGISSGIEPRKAAEALRIALDAKLGTQFKTVTSVFKELDDSDQVVMLQGRRLATATFTIEFQLAGRNPLADVTPAPSKSSLASAK